MIGSPRSTKWVGHDPLQRLGWFFHSLGKLLYFAHGRSTVTAKDVQWDAAVHLAWQCINDDSWRLSRADADAALRKILPPQPRRIIINFT